MPTTERLPAAVLICHQSDRLDSVGLASWLASAFELAGIVEIQGDRRRFWRVARRELARNGLLGFVDMLAFRAFALLRHRKSDAAWISREVSRLQHRYPADLDRVPRIVVDDPNGDRARAFIAVTAPDLIIARCKFILKPEIFALARTGAFALHPGICPEYRNAHGCFWALVNRDHDRVGMTLLKIDRGVDTGPVLLHAGCDYDEAAESHIVIQHRVVTNNLDRIAATLRDAARGSAIPVDTTARPSAAWGQPRLTAYWRWKRAARRDRQQPSRVSALP